MAGMKVKMVVNSLTDDNLMVSKGDKTVRQLIEDMWR